MKILENWLFIAHPSVRTLAYLQTFCELSVMPECIIWMSPKKRKVPEAVEEHWQRFEYNRYFQINAQVAADSSYRSLEVESDNINSPEIASLIAEINPVELLFSGGGIVATETFATSNARWIHFHPGSLPDYRGSTCFYYSYLNDKRLDCTGFEMTPVLDQGKVLVECQFRLNYPLRSDEVFFIDYVLDPQIRRLALKAWLQNVLQGNPEYANLTGSAISADGWPYYVIHTELRALCASKIANDFQQDMATGIFLKGIH